MCWRLIRNSETNLGLALNALYSETNPMVAFNTILGLVSGILISLQHTYMCFLWTTDVFDWWYEFRALGFHNVIPHRKCDDFPSSMENTWSMTWFSGLSFWCSIINSIPLYIVYHYLWYTFIRRICSYCLLFWSWTILFQTPNHSVSDCYIGYISRTNKIILFSYMSWVLESDFGTVRWSFRLQFQ